MALVATAVIPVEVPVGYINPNFTTDLQEHAFEAMSPDAYELEVFVDLCTLMTAYNEARSYVLPALYLTTFFDDFYNRIHVTPRELVLGNLGSEQSHQIVVWNAYLVDKVLTSADVLDSAGFELTFDGALPYQFQALAVVPFTLEVQTSGPSTIDTELVFTFTGLDGVTVPITGTRMLPWTVPPDWRSGVTEALEWLTEVQVAIDGSRDTEPMRETPRRSWEFDLVEGAAERRIAENMLFDWSGRVWALPVWADISVLKVPVALGATEVPVDTTHLDFVDGGQALLWSSVQQYELVDVATVEASRLLLVRPTLKAWSVGDRVYPCRQARLSSAPSLTRKSHQVVETRLQFEADEPCDWPAIAPAATYLGYPVFDARSDESDDPAAAYPRRLTVLDNEVGLVAAQDITNLVWSTQSHAWRLQGRADRATHRSLLYWLAGRARSVWLPTWAVDLQVVANSNGDSLTVAWCGVSRLLHQQTGRRHLRIELVDGRVFYRRAAAASEVDAAREIVALDPVMGENVAPAQIALISWMSLTALVTDRVEITHVTDSMGVADCAVSFEATPGEEPA